MLFEKNKQNKRISTKTQQPTESNYLKVGTSCKLKFCLCHLRYLFNILIFKFTI